MNLKSLLRPRTVVVLVVLALVLTGFVSCRGKGDGQTYRTEAIDVGTIAQTVSANGTLNPVTLVSVGTQVSGTITATRPNKPSSPIPPVSASPRTHAGRPAFSSACRTRCASITWAAS